MIFEEMNRAAAFHGHSCPGLAIGVRACCEARARLDLSFSADEELVCVVEHNACGVDAVQALLGCSLGKGNLVVRPTGKMAFTFFVRGGGALRLYFKGEAGELAREEWQKRILTAPFDELFCAAPPSFPCPERARRFSNVTCSVCGESAPEHKIRLQEGKFVCLDCFRPYERGFGL